MATDVSDRASVRHAAERALEAFGALHVACNNTGITIHGRSVADLTPQEWDWNIGVNLHGVIHGIETKPASAGRPSDRASTRRNGRRMHSPPGPARKMPVDRRP